MWYYMGARKKTHTMSNKDTYQPSMREVVQRIAQSEKIDLQVVEAVLMKYEEITQKEPLLKRAIVAEEVQKLGYFMSPEEVDAFLIAQGNFLVPISKMAPSILEEKRTGKVTENSVTEARLKISKADKILNEVRNALIGEMSGLEPEKQESILETIFGVIFLTSNGPEILFDLVNQNRSAPKAA
jgi:hypothetical protein